MLSSSLEAVGETSVLTLSPPSSGLSLAIEKESEKTREEVKGVRGTMWTESLPHLINPLRPEIQNSHDN